MEVAKDEMGKSQPHNCTPTTAAKEKKRTGIKEEDIIVVPPVVRLVASAKDKDGRGIEGKGDVVIPLARGSPLNLRGGPGERVCQ